VHLDSRGRHVFRSNLDNSRADYSFRVLDVLDGSRVRSSKLCSNGRVVGELLERKCHVFRLHESDRVRESV